MSKCELLPSTCVHFVVGEYFTARCESEEVARRLLESIETRTGHNGLRVLPRDEALGLYPSLLPVSRAIKWCLDGLREND